MIFIVLNLNSFVSDEMNHLDVTIEADPKQAKACIESILPELEADMHERSDVAISYDGSLQISITAKDLSAMRAAANTYLRWVDMCLKLVETRF